MFTSISGVQMTVETENITFLILRIHSDRKIDITPNFITTILENKE